VNRIRSGEKIPKPFSVPGECSIIHNPEMHRPIITLITRETWLECTERSHKTHYKITRFYLFSEVTLEQHKVKELITSFSRSTIDKKLCVRACGLNLPRFQGQSNGGHWVKGI
jgi:hypothetical protein